MKTVYNPSRPITRKPASALLTRRVAGGHLAMDHGASVITLRRSSVPAAVPRPGQEPGEAA